MNLFKRSVCTPFGAGVLAATIAAVVLSLMVLAVTYTVGGADAVVGGATGLWGMFVMDPVHTAMIQVIRGCVVIAAVVGIFVGVVVAVTRRGRLMSPHHGQGA